MQARVATRRNIKAQQKIARKEFRHLLSNISNTGKQPVISKPELGLKTRKNSTRFEDLRQNIVNAAVAQRR